MLPFCQIRVDGRKPQNPSYPVTPRTLGEHIRKRRLDLRMTMRQAADWFGVIPQTIRNWERDTTPPPSVFRAAIRIFLVGETASVDDLFAEQCKGVEMALEADSGAAGVEAGRGPDHAARLAD